MKDKDVAGMPKKYCVFREPDHVLLRIEPDGFTAKLLAEKYGAGDYTIQVYVGEKLIRQYRQVVDKAFRD